MAKALGEAQGRETMVPLFEKLLADYQLLIQGAMSGVIVLDAEDPDRARGRWHIHEHGRTHDGKDMFTFGLYHDDYVREDGRWRFAQRRYDSLLHRVGDDERITPYPADAPDIG